MNHRARWLQEVAALPDDPSAPVVPVPQPPVAGPLFSQEQLSALAAREKRQGRDGATAEILKALGVEKLDDAKGLLQAARDAQAAQQNDAQRAQAAAQQAQQAAEQAQREATQERNAARVERALIAAGVPVTIEKDGKPAANPGLLHAARLVDVDPTADAAAVTAAVERLRAELPAFFGPAAPVTTPSTAPTADPGRAPTAPAPSGQRGSAGLEMARKRGYLKDPAPAV